MVTPHIRKGHYRRVGKELIWIRATIVNKVAFFLNFHKLKKEQQDKYYEFFISNISMQVNSAKVANTTNFKSKNKDFKNGK